MTLSKNDDGFDVCLDNYVGSLIRRYRPSNRLLLVNPIQFDIKRFDIGIAKRMGYYAYPPTGLLFLAACIKHLNIEVAILDLNYEVLRQAREESKFDRDSWKRILLQQIERFGPSVVGVTCMFTSLRSSFENVLKFLKKMDRFVLLAGGTHVSFEYESLLKSDLCHFAFSREGENRFPYLLGKLLSTAVKEGPTAGIYYCDSGTVKESKGTDIFPKIDIDIKDVYDLIPIEKYCKAGSLNQYSRTVGREKAFSAISMNRGCRGHCTFCSVRTLLGNKIRGRSIDCVLDELRYLAKVRGIAHFDWLDDDLLANRRNCLILFRRMKEEDLNLRWYANNGVMASTLDEELLRAMVGSGCIGFKVGVETGNEEIRRKIRKPTSLSKLLELSICLRKFPELFVAGNYIIGFPYEKFSQMLDTFLFANKMNIDWAGFYICQPIKGAEEFNNFELLGDERCRKQGPDNYLPVREMEVNFKEEEGEILNGLDIFKLDRESFVSPEQLKEIWFVFGFITNFIDNKNLRPLGQVRKFIGWVTAAMDVYPSDAGMALFLYFGYLIVGDKDKAKEYRARAKTLYEKSAYWQRRFQQFLLTPTIEKKVNGPDDVFKFLASLRRNLPLPAEDR